MKALLSLVLFFPLPPASLLAAQRQIDGAHSTLTIHVGKTGLLSAAGHEHTVVAPIAQGTIDDDPAARIVFWVQAACLVVQPEEDREEIQHTMQEQALESSRYPEIRFASDTVQSTGDEQWDVAGVLVLHSVSKPVRVHVRRAADRYVGETTIKQSSFGIKPMSAGGGIVKVQDELKIEFSITTK